MSAVENLRNERKGRTVPLTLFYEDFKKDSPKRCYCFVEGKDDVLYYRAMFRILLTKEWDFIFYPAEGKENVKYVFKEISKKDIYEKRVTYYVDRDLSLILQKDDFMSKENVYATDGYSIENDMLTAETFKNISQDLLGFSSLSQEELGKLKNLYVSEKNKFEKMMAPIMAHIIYLKQYCQNRQLYYDNFNLKKVIIVQNGKVRFKVDQENAIDELYKASALKREQTYKWRVDRFEDIITKKQLFSKITRGKYLATFFIVFCNSIYKDCLTIGFKRNKGRELTDRDIMETIAPRSEPTESLRKFVCSHIIGKV